MRAGMPVSLTTFPIFPPAVTVCSVCVLSLVCAATLVRGSFAILKNKKPIDYT